MRIAVGTFLGAMLWFLLVSAVAVGYDQPQSRLLDLQVTVSEDKTPAHTLTLKADQMDVPGAIETSDVLPHRSAMGYPNDSAFVHPGIADGGSSNMFLAYEAHTNDTLLYWKGSVDNGTSFATNAYWASLDATFPSVNYWGRDTLFYGTVVPSAALYSGGRTYLVKLRHPARTTNWTYSSWDWTTMGWHDMRMADIACDSTGEFTKRPGNYAFGVISLVHSSTYTSPALVNVPHIFYERDTTVDGYTTMSWNATHTQCLSTSIDIDKATHYCYSVFDPYESGHRILFVRRDKFGDMENTSLQQAYTYALSSLQHIQYPSVAANGGKVVVVAEYYNGSSLSNTDIVCFYNPSHDGSVASMSQSTVIATGGSERAPKVSHVMGDLFLCTFVRGDTLYRSTSCDGGANWAAPTAVSPLPNDRVVSEYRATDMSNKGSKSVWEYRKNGAVDSSIFIHYSTTIGLDVSDVDGDNIAAICDNCPNVYNPSQVDGDGDRVGDACDNCPTVANADQADANGNGIGDVCELWVCGPPGNYATAGHDYARTGHAFSPLGVDPQCHYGLKWKYIDPAYNFTNAIHANTTPIVYDTFVVSGGGGQYVIFSLNTGAVLTKILGTNPVVSPNYISLTGLNSTPTRKTSAMTAAAEAVT